MIDRGLIGSGCELVAQPPPDEDTACIKINSSAEPSGGVHHCVVVLITSVYFWRIDMRRLILATAATLALGSMAFAQTATNVETEVFVTAKPTDVISSNILNLDITNSKDESIGKIQDLIISEGALTGYIVSVGGFLGIGEKYVIVAPQSVEIPYAENDKKWSAKMDTTKEALEKAPEFKYEGRWAK